MVGIVDERRQRVDTESVRRNIDHHMQALGNDPDYRKMILDACDFFDAHPKLNGWMYSDHAAMIQNSEFRDEVAESLERMVANRIKAKMNPRREDVEEEKRAHPFERRTAKDLWPARKGRKIHHMGG